MSRPVPARVPVSTYRFQVSADLDLHEVARLAAYVHDLGVDERGRQPRGDREELVRPAAGVGDVDGFPGPAAGPLGVERAGKAEALLHGGAHGRVEGQSGGAEVAAVVAKRRGQGLGVDEGEGEAQGQDGVSVAGRVGHAGTAKLMNSPLLHGLLDG